MTPSHSIQKNLEIEILRGFAILFTLVVHLKVLLHSQSGIHDLLAALDLSVGVDLFLVISGFVITSSLFESTREYPCPPRRLMLAFWIKRVFRLMPAAWTWILISVLVQIGIMAFTDLNYDPAVIARDSTAALFNVMNWYTPHCVANGGGTHCIIGNWVGHYWSLSLEEQFYLIFPLLFFWLPRKVFVAVLVVAIAAQFYWSRPFFTYAWYFKTDALCWGILLSLAGQQAFYQRLSAGIFLQNWIGKILGITLLVLLPVIAMDIQGIGHQMKPYGVAVVALMCAAIVWLASLQHGAFYLTRPYNTVMLYLGSRSYSLYLAHMVIYYSTRDSFQALSIHTPGYGSTLAQLVIALPLTAFSAELTYRLIERRLRHRGRQIAARQLSATSLS